MIFALALLVGQFLAPAAGLDQLGDLDRERIGVVSQLAVVEDEPGLR
jgi:hypothetical protein